MHRFPIIRGNHLDRIPGAAIQECPIRTFAGAFLAANAEIRVNFDAPERRVIFVRNPKHASFNRAILGARRRARAPGAAIGRDGQDARPFLARGFAVADGHGPVLLYDVEHFLISSFPYSLDNELSIINTLTQALSLTQRGEK